MNRKPRILALSKYYLPGYKGGGALRALSYLINHLKDNFEFVVLTTDADDGDANRYSDSNKAQTREKEGYEIRYVYGLLPTLAAIYRALQEPWDVVYLNSSIAPKFSLFPLALHYLGLSKAKHIIVAPRGEFMKGALQSKPLKKKFFLLSSRLIQLYKNTIFHTTSHEETKELERLNINNIIVRQAKDLPPKASQALPIEAPPKQKNHLKIIFTSRIDTKKNLHYAISLLQEMTGDISFDIFGPISNESYWQHCQSLLAKLPPNITARYHGPIPHDEILLTFSRHHLFLFPTLAENNGYVITESLTAGCPVLISDCTPWKNLESLGVGQEIPLDDPAAFRNALARWVAMDEKEYAQWTSRARHFGLSQMQAEKDVEDTKALFNYACGG